MSEPAQADEESTSAVAELTMRIVIIVYIGGFALAGHLLWKPVYNQYFVVETAENAGAVHQMLAGASDAMVTLGMFGGVMAATILLGLWLRHTGGDGE